MKLYIVRHSVPTTAASEMDPESDVELDAELTPEGEQIVREMARWMADNDEIPSVVYASPTTRTQQTAQILVDELGLPDVMTDVSMGAGMSIRRCVLALANDDMMSRPCIVSHHEAISAGMRELNGGPHPPPMAMGELRILKVKRKNGKWVEERRVLPSDLGLDDHYD